MHATRIDIEKQQFTLGPQADIGLLQLQHLHVFVKNFALSFTDFDRELGIIGFELARHAPVIPMRSFSFWRNKVHHHAVGFVFRRGIETTPTCQCDPHINHDVSGRREATNLPTIDLGFGIKAVGTHGHLPKRRGLNALHVALQNNLVTFYGCLAWCFINLGLTNAVGMHISFVR